MNFHKLTFFIAALVACIYLTKANESLIEARKPAATLRPCLRTCNEHYKCNPYYKDIVYTIENGVCRLIQNPCIFSNINCNRRNQCQTPLVQTTEKMCKAACPVMCLMGGSGVCAQFYSYNSEGERVVEEKSFVNQCILNSYTCATGTAYHEVVDGFCS